MNAGKRIIICSLLIVPQFFCTARGISDSSASNKIQEQLIPVPSAEARPLEAETVSEASETVLFVKTNIKDCSVFLNGEYQGRTPLTLYSLTPGAYPLSVRKAGYTATVYSITLSHNIESRFYVSLSPVSAPATVQ